MEPNKSWIDRFIVTTSKAFLIVFGLATCLPILLVFNLELSNVYLFSGLLEYGPASEPALRHWGIMVFGVGVLMIVAAYRPQLRFETLVFSTIEKVFMVYLFLTYRNEPWAEAYQIGFFIDLAIVLYSLVYFGSRYGRPSRWIKEGDSLKR